MSTERRFTEKQVADIITRAGELQMKQPDSSATGMGTNDLMRVAAELGIRPEYVERALAEGGRTDAGSPFRLVRTWEQILDGEPDFDRLAEVGAENAFSSRQFGRQIGNAYLQSILKFPGRYNITIRKLEGQTRVKVESNALPVAVLSGLFGFYGFLFTMAGFESVLAPVAIPLILVAWMVLSAVVFVMGQKGVHRKLPDVAERYLDAIRPVAKPPVADAVRAPLTHGTASPDQTVSS